MFDAETISLITLSLIEGVGSTIIQKLLSFFGSAEEALTASHQELSRVMGLSPGVCHKIVSQRDKTPLEEELSLIEKHVCQVITIHDSSYPERLRTIFDPPQILYVKGELPPQDALAISIVGSRRATSYGRMMSERLSGELSSKGFIIVGGFARGIDSVAHRGAISAGGETIAVMGNGLSTIYPPENVKLMEEVITNGAAISEFPMKTPPLSTNFPRRNRVISGLSIGVLVVEASEKSGSLITAKFALEQGREVFAVPGEISSTMSKGTNYLIKQGAALVETVDDILDALSLNLPQTPKVSRVSQVETPPDIKLGDDEQVIWDLLSQKPTHIDEIARASELSPGKISSILVILELKGIIQQLPGKQFVRKMTRKSALSI